MAITNYSELQTAIGNWLNRTDLTARIPEFIALAEAGMSRELELPTIVVGHTLTAGQDFFVTSLGYPTSVRMDTTTYTHPLTLVSLAALADLRRATSGVPFYYAIADKTLYFDVSPAAAYDIEVTYCPSLAPLTTGNTTNTVLQRWPDIYLNGALKEAELYLEHDDRNPVWSQRYDKGVSDANIALERAQLGARPASIRLPIVLG